jgi:hypothetical protein
MRYVLVEVPAWNSALIGSYRGFQDDEREGCSREDDTDENIGDDIGVDADADVNADEREDGGEDI